MDKLTIELTEKEMDMLSYLICAEIFRMKDFEKTIFESGLIYNIDELDNVYIKLMRI